MLVKLYLKISFSLCFQAYQFSHMYLFFLIRVGKCSYFPSIIL